jgi:hypothetical protein
MIGTELFEICEQLARDAGGRKVMVCGSDGDVLAHAGEAGLLDEATADALAGLVGDVIDGAAAAPSQELVIALPSRGLQACGAAVGTRAALLVVFDATTQVERVRAKVRRARELLGKSLPDESGPAAS